MDDMDKFLAFPNANFDYGYGPGMRQLREAVQASRGPQRRAAFSQAIAAVTWPQSIREPQNRDSKRRSSLKHPGRLSELGVDDYAVVHGINGAREFFEAVLAEHPIRPFADVTLTLNHLCQYRPWEKPSESLGWENFRAEVRDIRIQAATAGWTQTMDIPVFNITVEQVEALRIIGDAARGFGSFPITLLTDLDEAGLSFLLVEPGRRIIPRCWKPTCDKNEIPYHEVTHTMRGGDWNSDRAKHWRRLLNSRGLVADPEELVPSKAAATSAFQRANARGEYTVDDLLTERPEGLNRDQRFIAMEADIRKIAEVLVEETSANLLGGPIEGLVIHLLKKTFARMGVRTKGDFENMVGGIAAVQFDDFSTLFGASKKEICLLAITAANSGKERLDKDYAEMRERVEEITAAVRDLQTDAVAKDGQIQKNTETLDTVQHIAEILQPELGAIKAQVNSDAQSLVHRVAAAIEAQCIDTKVASAIQGHFTKEQLESAVQAAVADALNHVIQNEVDTASKLSDINRRLDDLASKLASATQPLPPWGADLTDVSSVSAPDGPPSASQPPPRRRGPSLKEGIQRRLEELKTRRSQAP
ncbi:hypothetical protein DL769_000637 [Monosporascus sp. CRB-8-3]|nr:hypothetical protein DL769_000637 [Monosporascus sp. CRB-8-3]